VTEQVIERLEQMKSIRDEALEVIKAMVSYAREPEEWEPVHGFFQRCVSAMDLVFSGGSANGWSRDHFRFFGMEVFLYTCAMLLKRQRYSVLGFLLAQPYMYVSRGEEVVGGHEVFHQAMESLRAHYVALGQRWHSPSGQMLKERHESAFASFSELTQADLALSIRSRASRLRAGEEWAWEWFARTLPYAETRRRTLPLFQRAASVQHFDQLKQVLGVRDREELTRVAKSFGKGGYLFEYRVSVPGLVGVEDIAAK
jgi:hypothetical protein